MCRNIFFCLAFIFLRAYSPLAQSFPLSNFSLASDLQSYELTGKIQTGSSYMIRPVGIHRRLHDSLLRVLYMNDVSEKNPGRKGFYGKLLPISSVTKFTSHHPFGWSDGALMPANGLQQLFNVGYYAKLGPLSMQVSPEFIWAANKTYERSDFYGAANPTKNYTTFLPGQSFLKLEQGAFGLGVSTENIWWGPGHFSSLIMSNNAPGNFHASFHTARPAKTPIGKFEWQLIGGILKDEPRQSDEIYGLKTFNDIFGVFEVNRKYLNAISIVYQPSFLKNLSIGASRAFIGNISNVDSLGTNDNKIRAFLPVFDKLFKSKLVNEDQRGWNQLISLSIKLSFPKAHAEVYTEYGWNDHKANLRDLLMAPTHSAAYLVGAKKIVPLEKKRSLELIAEINQMEQSPDYLVRGAGNWYIHWFKTNYSNYGQVLGSGIGFGNNALSFSAMLRDRQNTIGLLFHKIQQDPNTKSVRWSDYAWGLQGRVGLPRFLFSYKFYGVKSVNYAWMQDENRFNFVGTVGVSYLLK